MFDTIHFSVNTIKHILRIQIELIVAKLSYWVETINGFWMRRVLRIAATSWDSGQWVQQGTNIEKCMGTSIT